MSPHEALIGALAERGITASEEDTGGGVRCVTAHLPGGIEFTARLAEPPAPQGSWLVGLDDRGSMQTEEIEPDLTAVVMLARLVIIDQRLAAIERHLQQDPYYAARAREYDALRAAGVRP